MTELERLVRQHFSRVQIQTDSLLPTERAILVELDRSGATRPRLTLSCLLTGGVPGEQPNCPCEACQLQHELPALRARDAAHSADGMIGFLNSLLAVDPFAIAELMAIRVPCGEALADHPTVQVMSASEKTFMRPGTFKVGILGVLNGFYGVDENGWGPITAKFVADTGEIHAFEHTRTRTRSSDAAKVTTAPRKHSVA